jgi:hypothetical protein
LYICVVIKKKHIMTNKISVDRLTFTRLKKEYQTATKSSKDVFIFDGKVLLTSYAKYLIEYLTPMFK